MSPNPLAAVAGMPSTVELHTKLHAENLPMQEVKERF
jgi:hypothetical protein